MLIQQDPKKSFQTGTCLWEPVASEGADINVLLAHAMNTLGLFFFSGHEACATHILLAFTPDGHKS